MSPASTSPLPPLAMPGLPLMLKWQSPCGEQVMVCAPLTTITDFKAAARLLTRTTFCISSAQGYLSVPVSASVRDGIMPEASAARRRRESSPICGVSTEPGGTSPSICGPEDIILSASASRIRVGAAPASRMSRSLENRSPSALTVSGARPRPGPTAIEEYLEIQSGTAENIVEDGSHETMAEGCESCTASLSPDGTCAVTRPQPERRAPPVQSIAAPIISLQPAIIRACPKLPLWPYSFLGSSIERTVSRSTVA